MLYEKQYKLKQETPMIHFQHSEDGAILRGSELKPKFDKFIVGKIGLDIIGNDLKLNGKESIYYNFFVERPVIDKDKNVKFGHLALNYKVKIAVNGLPEKSECINRDIEILHDSNNRRLIQQNYTNRNKDINSMYFGNMVDSNASFTEKEKLIREKYKETVFYSELIDLTIVCFDENLSNKIEEYIYEFFLVSSFGTRQDKGFGSFTLVDEQNNYNIIQVLNNGNYKYFYAFENTITKEIALEIVRGIYAVMKGGLNRSLDRNGRYHDEKYIKGYIQREYLDEIELKTVGSDKAFVKSKVLPSDIIREKETHNNYNEFLYVRALLGVPASYVYKDPDRVRFGEVAVEPIGAEADNFRFKSPLQITVHGNYILFIFDEKCYSEKTILKREFEFCTYRNQRVNGKVIKVKDKSEKIKVPESFDINQFIKGFVAYYETEKTKLNGLKCVPATNKLEIGGEKI